MKARPAGMVEMVDPQEILGTAEHPFYVYGKGWTPLAELQPGDWIRTDNGWVEVGSVTDTGEYRTVYNLRVADHHTYFVGAPDWGFGVWAHNTYADFMKVVVDSDLDPKLSLGSRRFRAGTRNPNGVDGDLYALAHEHLPSSEMPPAFAQAMRQKFGNITEAQIQQAWIALKADPAGVGATVATRAGSISHKVFADADRASGHYDQVGTMMRTKAGEPILVPYEVDLRTGAPIPGKGTQRAFPDAVSFARGEIVDYKPVGRLLSKDRQEIIRNITAYRIRQGSDPNWIVIREYDAITMKLVNETKHLPSLFLPGP